MTADVLARLIGMNLAAGAAILLVLVLRIPVRRAFGARIAYALWLLAPVAASVYLAPIPAFQRVITRPAPAVMAQPVAPPATTPRAKPQAAVAEAFAPAPAPMDWPALLLDLWIAGAALSLIRTLLAQRQAMNGFGALTPAAGLRAFHASRASSGPALIGFIRPKLVLPADFEDRFNARERHLVLTHERTHLAHGDTAINALIALVRVLGWFNPLVHVAAFYARVDQELACDAAVVKRFPGERRVYAEAMLKSQLAQAPLPLGCYWPGRSANLLKARIEMLGEDSPTLPRSLARAGLVAGLALGAGLAAWAAEPPEVRIAPAASPAAIGAALGGPAQPKLITPQAAPSVTAPDTLPLAREPGLAEALAAGDTQRALDLGASAADIVRQRRPELAGQDIDAAFIRSVGDLQIAYRTGGARRVEFILMRDFRTLADLADLPTLDDYMAPPAAVTTAVAARAVAGGSAEEVGRTLLAQMPSGAQIPAYDISTARYVRDSGNTLYVGVRAPTGQVAIMEVKGAEAFPGISSLPLVADAFPWTGVPPPVRPAP